MSCEWTGAIKWPAEEVKDGWEMDSLNKSNTHCLDVEVHKHNELQQTSSASQNCNVGFNYIIQKYFPKCYSKNLLNV